MSIGKKVQALQDSLRAKNIRIGQEKNVQKAKKRLHGGEVKQEEEEEKCPKAWSSVVKIGQARLTKKCTEKKKYLCMPILSAHWRAPSLQVLPRLPKEPALSGWTRLFPPLLLALLEN